MLIIMLFYVILMLFFSLLTKKEARLEGNDGYTNELGNEISCIWGLQRLLAAY